MEPETFDMLFKCLKILEETMIKFPEFGTQKNYSAVKHDDEREVFNLMINRKGHLNEDYLTYQLTSRYGILVRLDMDGSPHEDREGNLVDTPHLHIFDEENGFGKFAVSLSDVVELNIIKDLYDSLSCFMEYNNIRPVDFDLTLF